MDIFLLSYLIPVFRLLTSLLPFWERIKSYLSMSEYRLSFLHRKKVLSNRDEDTQRNWKFIEPNKEKSQNQSCSRMNTTNMQHLRCNFLMETISNKCLKVWCKFWLNQHFSIFAQHLLHFPPVTSSTSPKYNDKIGLHWYSNFTNAPFV